MALILGNGGRPLSLGSRPEGVRQVIAGTNVIATKPTTFGLGLNPSSGSAAVGFQGGLQLDINNSPDPILNKGVLDLGTGQYEATGSLNNIPTSSVHIVGNLKSGSGNAHTCVLLLICFNTPIDTKDKTPAPPAQPPNNPED